MNCLEEFKIYKAQKLKSASILNEQVTILSNMMFDTINENQQQIKVHLIIEVGSQNQVTVDLSVRRVCKKYRHM